MQPGNNIQGRIEMAADVDRARAARVRHSSACALARSDKVPAPGLLAQRAAMVQAESQQGFGTLLMEEAERIAREEHGSLKLAVISGLLSTGWCCSHSCLRLPFLSLLTINHAPSLPLHANAHRAFPLCVFTRQSRNRDNDRRGHARLLSQTRLLA